MLEILNCVGDALLGPEIHVIAALQIQAVRPDVRRVAFGAWRWEFDQLRRPQRIHDRLRDFILNRKDVVELAIIALRPEKPAVFR